MIDELNKDFESGEDPILFYKTETYLNLLCKYNGCKFQYWFKQEDTKCMLYRSLNMNHSKKAHEAKIVKAKLAIIQLSQTGE